MCRRFTTRYLFQPPSSSIIWWWWCSCSVPIGFIIFSSMNSDFLQTRQAIWPSDVMSWPLLRYLSTFALHICVVMHFSANFQFVPTSVACKATLYLYPISYFHVLDRYSLWAGLRSCIMLAFRLHLSLTNKGQPVRTRRKRAYFTSVCFQVLGLVQP